MGRSQLVCSSVFLVAHIRINLWRVRTGSVDSESLPHNRSLWVWVSTRLHATGRKPLVMVTAPLNTKLSLACKTLGP